MSLPVVVVSGFLGAGKTTFLKQLLASAGALRIGVVLNEIGIAGIDVLSAEAFAELSEACACCVRSTDFVRAMQTMAARHDLDLVILETTGTADPLPIMWRLEHDSLHAVVRLSCVVTLVDPTHPESYTRDEWAAQVQAADFIVFSKADLAAIDTAPVLAVQPNARIKGAAEIAAVVLSETPIERGEIPRFALPRHSALHGVVFALPGVFSLDALEEIFDALPAAIVRAKAIALTQTGWTVIHRVGTRLHSERDQAPPAHGESRFAFFAEQLDAAALERVICSARA